MPTFVPVWVAVRVNEEADGMLSSGTTSSSELLVKLISTVLPAPDAHDTLYCSCVCPGSPDATNDMPVSLTPLLNVKTSVASVVTTALAAPRKSARGREPGNGVQ